MLIKPSTTLDKEKQEPVIEAHKYREEILDLREKLLSTEASRLSGAKTYTIAEVSERLRGSVDGNP